MEHAQFASTGSTIEVRLNLTSAADFSIGTIELPKIAESLFVPLVAYHRMSLATTSGILYTIREMAWVV